MGFKLGGLGGCCCTPPGVSCSSCSTGKAPQCLQVTISGVAEGTCGCDRCDELNTTWNLVNRGSGWCQWNHNLCSPESPYNICAYYNGSTLTAGFSSLSAEIAFVSGTTYRLTVTLTGGGGTTIWQKDFTSGKPDCEAWASESIPFVSSTANASFTCAFASSTLTVSAGSSGCDSGTSCTTKDGCKQCEGLDNPDEIEVTISDDWTHLTNCLAGAHTINCSDAAGTFVLTKTGECQYDYSFGASNCCEWASLQVRIERPALTDNVEIVVRLVTGNCDSGGDDDKQTIEWRNTYTKTAACPQVNCRDLLEAGLAVAFDFSGGDVERCQWDGTTVTVTGIYN